MESQNPWPCALELKGFSATSKGETELYHPVNPEVMLFVLMSFFYKGEYL